MRKSIVLSDDFAHDPLFEQLALKTITSLDRPFLPRLYASFTDERYLYLVTVSVVRLVAVICSQAGTGFLRPRRSSHLFDERWCI